MLSLPHSPQAAVARRTRRAAPASQRPPARGLTSTTFIASGRRAAVGERGHVVQRRDDALREQQPRREIQIVAGRSHRDDQALAGDPDLQRLLGDNEIAIGGQRAGAAPIAAALDGALDDPYAGLRPDRQ